jgi:hypothetical protein
VGVPSAGGSGGGSGFKSHRPAGLAAGVPRAVSTGYQPSSRSVATPDAAPDSASASSSAKKGDRLGDRSGETKEEDVLSPGDESPRPGEDGPGASEAEEKRRKMQSAVQDSLQKLLAETCGGNYKLFDRFLSQFMDSHEEVGISSLCARVFGDYLLNCWCYWCCCFAAQGPRPRRGRRRR